MMKKGGAQKMPAVDFDLRQLEIFRKVVELRSFSKAADAVFLAQASVSERIATLEGMVGTRLLDRLGRKIVPTRAGELLYKHAVLLLEMKRTATLEMQDFLGLKQGEIRMGGSTIPGEYILPEVIGRFRKKHPLVSVTLVISDSAEIEGRVQEGELELGVVGSKSADPTLISYDLWRDELALVVPASHRWAALEEVAIEDLFGEPFILRESGSGTLEILEDYFRSSGRELGSLETAARFGSSTAVKEGIKAGVGVSILSIRALHPEREAGLLKAVKLRGVDMTRTFYLLRDKRRIASPPAQAMLEFLLAIAHHGGSKNG
jgi:DNA-binding transcriptional LysR family regulator